MHALRALPEITRISYRFHFAVSEAEPPDDHFQAGAWERDLIPG